MAADNNNLRPCSRWLGSAPTKRIPSALAYYTKDAELLGMRRVRSARSRSGDRAGPGVRSFGQMAELDCEFLVQDQVQTGRHAHGAGMRGKARPRVPANPLASWDPVELIRVRAAAAVAVKSGDRRHVLVQ